MASDRPSGRLWLPGEPNSEKYAQLRSEAGVQTLEAAITDAEVVLVAIPEANVPDFVADNRGFLGQALTIDATNDTAGGRFHHLDVYQESVPEASVFRAFNTLGWENFADPEFDGVSADLFLSGPDAEERATVEGLLRDVGLLPIYVGSEVAGADLLDGLTRLWFTLALQRGFGRHLAFRTVGAGADRGSRPLDSPLVRLRSLPRGASALLTVPFSRRGANRSATYVDKQRRSDGP